MIFREGFQDEDFVAFYNGDKFYTGPLDSNFTEALERLISLRALAFGDIVEYLESIGVSDVNIDDTFDVASTFSKALFYDAADGEDYWNFYGFEIFPEYELAESFRKSKKGITERHHEFRHSLPANPSDYETFVNYAETLVWTCDNVMEKAETYLSRVENGHDFYEDPKNSAFYKYDEKMDKIAKLITKLEQTGKQIEKLLY